MSISAEQMFAQNPAVYRLDLDAYDPSGIGLGPLMTRQTGLNPEDNFVGPLPNMVSRPMEASTAIPFAFPWAMRWSETASDQKDWVFQADISTAAATRRIGMWETNRLTGVLNYLGFLTVTFPGTSEAKTIRGLRMSYEKYSAGTVAVAGTAVTGTTTAWQTNRCCVGNRIGFGSTDPAAITTWYEISATAALNAGIQLAANASAGASASASLETSVLLAAAATADAQASASLTTAIYLQAVAQAQASAGATLGSVGIELAAAAQALASASASLLTGVGLRAFAFAYATARATLAGSTPLEQDLERTYLVGPEDRSYLVEGNDRIYLVGPEDRALSVPFEDRKFGVGSEDRNFDPVEDTT